MTVPVIVANATPGPAGAPTLVLGPSLGTTSAVWDRSRPLLAGRRSLLAWDLPGHGRSPVARAPFTMAELAEGVLAAIDAAAGGPVEYAGISLGGVAGLQLALDHPDRVSRLTMVCSLPRIGTAEGWHERAAGVRSLGTPALVTATAGRWFTPEFLAREPDVASRALNELMDIDDESYALCVEALAGTDLRERMPELAMPFQLIVGAEDPVIPLSDAEDAASAAPDGALHVIAAASHLAEVEHPAQVAAILTREAA